MARILERIAALEAANKANEGSFSDLGTIKSDIVDLTNKVSAAATKDDLNSVRASIAAIQDEIGTEPAPAGGAQVDPPVAPADGAQQ